MLVSDSKIINQPVVGLQTASQLATTTGEIVDPTTLKVVALWLTGKQLDYKEPVLHTSDIREISSLGLIVDDSSSIMSTEGLVRLQKILDYDFKLVGLPVYNEEGKHLGKVSGYSFSPVDYKIMQIITDQSWLRSLTNGSNVIARSQIVFVSNKKIIVKSATVKNTRSVSSRMRSPQLQNS